jgi:cob(I)alamin adenosyltransferase
MTKARITSGYCEGKRGGDNGYSQLMLGVLIPKDHDTCKLYGAVEDFQQSIAICLEANELMDPSLEHVMKWLHTNMFSLSSYAFMKGETSNHEMPQGFLHYIEGAIEDMKADIGDAPDFLVYSHKSLIHLNEIRIRTREVESRFVGWKRSLEMQLHLKGPLAVLPFEVNVPLSWYEGKHSALVEKLFGKRYLLPIINYHIQVLNRLSSYFFWASRVQGKLLAGRSEDSGLIERYWQGKIEEFDIDCAKQKEAYVGRTIGATA